MSAIATQANRHKSWYSELPDQLSKAVDSYSLPEKPEWSGLDELSSHTFYEGIEVFGDQSVVEEDNFVAPANVYVRLTYGSKNDLTEMNDVYPARVHYRVVKKGPSVVIEKIDVDTSSFFE